MRIKSDILLKKMHFFICFQVVWHDGVRELPNSWQWLVEHDNGTGSNQKEINIELSRINLGLPLICKVNSSALDAPISKVIHRRLTKVKVILFDTYPYYSMATVVCN